VALVWPIKIVFLKAGQSRKKTNEEIFFNEVLAQDEINQLLDPKYYDTKVLLRRKNI
jgi:adenine-specific DNA-methyltransferase